MGTIPHSQEGKIKADKGPKEDPPKFILGKKAVDPLGGDIDLNNP